MASVVNAAQAEVWNGLDGTRYAEEPDRLDMVNGAFNADLFAAAPVAPEYNVLDIGCGTGQTTRIAAKRTRGDVVGIDLSAAMLETAREKARGEGLSNIEFVQGDAQVHEFPEGKFDVVLSRFGLMYFADPVQAMSHIARAMRPGARLAAVCVGDHGKGDWGQVFAAMAANLPMPEVPAGDMADGFPTPDNIARVLNDAGFTEVSNEEVVRTNVWGRDAEDAADFLFSFEEGRQVFEALDPEVRDRARRGVIEALRPFERPDGVHMSTPAWLTTAVRP
ncbi:methyltransferase domain-containing protein [Actinoallomurus sp. NBC_01490]|uniref:class I SAM-dependent methyltransferase n=1 Tax=Actinoallomurus sp. NBC_01490 TaxID=2903557 RepID=UPI002E34A9D8|nr:class I SAM-dependent methyltransferase [Actinoallomurus sp. NBC_01490]